MCEYVRTFPIALCCLMSLGILVHERYVLSGSGGQTIGF